MLLLLLLAKSVGVIEVKSNINSNASNYSNDNSSRSSNKNSSSRSSTVVCSICRVV